MKNLKIIVSLVYYIIAVDNINAQNQKGGDIDGAFSNDFFGCSVSMPSVNTIAIGSIGNDFNGSSAGRASVYTWSRYQWIQKGKDIYGDSAVDLFGSAICMPDDYTLAVGAIGNNGNGIASGQVKIYYLSGNTWIQKGKDIYGEQPKDFAGSSISMPDPNTISIGSEYNDGGGINSGHVRVFKWQNNAWIQKGGDIDGENTEDRSGMVCMPDSNTLAVGAYGNDGNGINAGHVRVFNWNGVNWIQKGSDIVGENPEDGFGCSISMPTENTIAIGAEANDGIGGTNPNIGQVRVYIWTGTKWIQKGNSIYGEYPDDRSGVVCMSSEDVLAIGASANMGANSMYKSGHVRIYSFSDNNEWTQIGSDIDGEDKDNYSGSAISMVDNTVAIGARYNCGIGYNAGHARVFSFNTVQNLKFKYDRSIVIFPNPTSNSLNINIEANLVGKNYYIKDPTGKNVKMGQLIANNTKVDLENLESGIYFITVGEFNIKSFKVTKK